MSNQDTRALVLIKRVVYDCSLDVVESMRQIRELAGVNATGWRDARMHNATERLRDVVRVLEGLQDTPAESPDPIAVPLGEMTEDICPRCRGRLTLDPDPIAELEALGCWVAIVVDQTDGGARSLYWVTPGEISDEFERIGYTASVAALRAAAARLLARVRGAK